MMLNGVSLCMKSYFAKLSHFTLSCLHNTDMRGDGDGENKLSVQQSKACSTHSVLGGNKSPPTEHEITFLQRRQLPRAVLTP